MIHPFFDDLRLPDAKMASGKDMPPLFDFTREGAFDSHHLRSFKLTTLSRPQSSRFALT